MIQPSFPSGEALEKTGLAVWLPITIRAVQPTSCRHQGMAMCWVVLVYLGHSQLARQGIIKLNDAPNRMRRNNPAMNAHATAVNRAK